VKRVLIVALLLAGAAFLLVQPVAAAPAAKPPLPVIKKLLTQHYTDKLYATRIYSIKWGPIQYGASRLGDYWADGVPANTKTTVYPVRATLTRTTHYTTDNSTVRAHIRADLVFFKDEYGTWTFRLKHEQMTR
jgi:hypothetical protein